MNKFLLLFFILWATCSVAAVTYGIIVNNFM